MAEKVVLGLSDGVDSAVAARVLVSEGDDVFGLYLDIGGERERADALDSARRLGIPLRVLPIREELEKFVCAPFARAYLNGKTPNPCIGCNPNVKFPALCRCADELGATFIATGHYAVCDRRHIYMGNPDNDQSYMLARLTDEQVSRLLLPLGAYEKARVREIAREMGLTVADKPDSRENCFIRGMSYADWIESREDVPGEGPAVFRGAEIGRHSGIHRYTVGQRWPEMIGDRRAYVRAIRADRNEIELCLWEDLFQREFHVSDAHWIGFSPDVPFRARVRVRHTRWETPDCTVFPAEGGARVVADEPLRAPAPGQAAAFYRDTMLLGGGYIEP